MSFSPHSNLGHASLHLPPCETRRQRQKQRLEVIWAGAQEKVHWDGPQLRKATPTTQTGGWGWGITTFEYNLQAPERECLPAKGEPILKHTPSSGPAPSSPQVHLVWLWQKSLCLYLHHSWVEESEQAVKSLPGKESESHLQPDQPWLHRNLAWRSKTVKLISQCFPPGTADTWSSARPWVCSTHLQEMRVLVTKKSTETWEEQWVFSIPFLQFRRNWHTLYYFQTLCNVMSG